MKPRFAAALLLVAPLLAYGNTVFHGFVYDDDLTVSECPLITSWSNFPLLFTQAYFDQTIEMSWRPVATLSLFLDHSLFGGVDFGYHLMNVLWHAGACFALWLLLARAVPPLPAVLGALLFAVHPLGSEAVNAISFREDLLTGLFAALAVLCALRAFAGERPALHAALAGAATLLGALSKESGAIIPLLIVLLAWTAAPESSRRARSLLVLSLSAALLLFVLLRFILMVPANPVSVPPWGGSLATAVWNFPRIFFHGIGLSLFPVNLSADYEWSAAPFGEGLLVWIGWLALLAFVAAVVLLRRRSPILAFGLGWWLLALLPVSNLMPLSNPVAERYFYLPLMGLCIAFAGVLDRLFVTVPITVPRVRFALAGSLCAALLLLLQLTVQRNLVWGDAERLWTATLAVESNSTTALNNLGCIRLSQGKPREAAEYLRRGLSVAPSDLDLINNYGIAMAELGAWDEARRAFEWSVERNPADSAAHWRLALCLSRSSRPDHVRAWEQLLAAESLGYQTPSNIREELRVRSQENSS